MGFKALWNKVTPPLYRISYPKEQSTYVQYAKISYPSKYIKYGKKSYSLLSNVWRGLVDQDKRSGRIAYFAEQSLELSHALWTNVTILFF